VFITDRGRPAHVLLSIKQYEDLTGPGASILELLSMPEAAQIELDVPKVDGIFRRADLS
jgi:PHD/YefM family antitoxin component YafN of YafNO toxin-antitoxin module